MKQQSDYFLASLEEGELVLEPYCACGEALAEQYYCEKCGRQCRCIEILCRDNRTLEYVTECVKSQPCFDKFSCALLNGRK